MWHDSSCLDNTFRTQTTCRQKRKDGVVLLDLQHKDSTFLKLQIDGKVFPDPYGIDKKDWINDVTTWPDLQFGDINTYLIDTKGTYTQGLQVTYITNI